MLFVVGDRKPVLDQNDAGADQHLFEFRHSAEEFLVLVFVAKSHHFFNTGAVVPTAVEKNDLTSRRQMGHITLKIPLAALPLTGRRKCGHPADTRIQPLGDALDYPSFAGCVTAFKKDDYFELLVHDPVLQLDQLALKAKQFPEIEASVQLLLVPGFQGLFDKLA